MKRYVQVILILSILGLFFGISFSIEQDIGPETMDLKERFKITGNKTAVIFQHWNHQNALESQCTKCHENEDGGGKIRVELAEFTGISNDFHKNFCWPCHSLMQVPKGKTCSTCHLKE